MSMSRLVYNVGSFTLIISKFQKTKMVSKLNIGVAAVILLLGIAVEGCLPLGGSSHQVSRINKSFQDSEEVVIASLGAGHVVKVTAILVTILILTLRRLTKPLRALIPTSHLLSIFLQKSPRIIIRN